MKLQPLNLLFLLLAALACSSVQAGRVNLDSLDSNQYPVVISSFNNSKNPAGFAGLVVGKWAFADSVTFSESGSYQLTLTDFGASRGLNPFNFLAAFISTSSSIVGGFLSGGSGSAFSGSWEFNLTEGDYWLSVLAVADPYLGFGVFGLNIEPTAVPLPAAGWLLLTSLIGLAAFGRRRRLIK